MYFKKLFKYLNFAFLLLRNWFYYKGRIIVIDLISLCEPLPAVVGESRPYPLSRSLSTTSQFSANNRPPTILHIPDIKPHVKKVHALLEKFWQISLYVTAIAKLYVT